MHNLTYNPHTRKLDVVGSKTAVTYTVASKTSKFKEYADFVCTGTASTGGDENQINEALNSLPQAGGIVQLLDGQFYGEEIVIPKKNNVWLRGIGGDATMLFFKNSATKNLIQSNTDQSGGILLTLLMSDFTLNGNKANAPGAGYGYYDASGSDEPDDTYFNTLFFLQFPTHAIRLDNAYNFKFIKSIVETTAGNCIDILKGNYVELDGFKFINGNAGHGLYALDCNRLIVHGGEIIVNTNSYGLYASTSTGALGLGAIMAHNHIGVDASTGAGAKGVGINCPNGILADNYIYGSAGRMDVAVEIGASATNVSGSGNTAILPGTVYSNLGGSVNGLQINNKWYSSVNMDFTNTSGLTLPALTADWDAGGYKIRAQTLESDIASGTAPLTIASTDKVTNLNADMVDGIHGFGYSLQFQAAILNTPADSTPYYIGNLAVAPQTVATLLKVYVPKSGTIKAAVVNFINTGAGISAETSTVNVRVNTTDNAISTAVVNNAAATVVSNTAMNIAVTAGDYLQISWTTPGWATNPTSVYINATVYIE